jgi:hypothetical protein
MDKSHIYEKVLKMWRMVSVALGEVSLSYKEFSRYTMMLPLG